MACCLFLPYVGPFLYLVFGVNRTRLQARRKRPFPVETDLVLGKLRPPGDLEFPLARIGRKVTHKDLLPCEALEVLVNGDQAYPRMLEAIANARTRVWLATYIFANGAVGERFLQALVEARGRGVDVRVLVDGMGELMSLPRIGRRLRRLGLPFHRFNPFTLLPPSLHVNMRNHRKILTVDGELAFTGGANISDANLLEGTGRGHRVQDLHFLFRGPLAAELESVFQEDWDYCEGRMAPVRHIIPATPATPVDPATPWARLVLDGPNEDLDQLSDILVGTFSAARSRIWIMTPYFLPDAELIGALQAARLRDVDVRIVLPLENNIPVVHWATRHLLWQLLDYGVEVSYQAPPFAHTKLLLIDDYYCQVGSANFDPRSLRLNYELSVEIFSRERQRELERYYQARLAGARRWNRADFEARSLPVRLRDALCWLFTPYL